MFKYRGIIEGFYGTPWSHEERLMLMKWMGERGYTHYIYAPKADTYHRANWRKPYPPDEMTYFKELINSAKHTGVVFGMAISPGLSMRYSSENDREALYKKIASFADLGIRFFGLFFDDIPLQMHHVEDQDNFRSLAEAQVTVVNEIYNRLLKEYQDFELFFCPTVYCGTGKEEYLQELGAGLHTEIQVFWTGPQVCSKKIRRTDLETVNKALKRKPVIWDNYPVNDGLMCPELHIGPFVGRDADVTYVAAGFFMNPMNQIYASLLPLHAIAEYLHNPGQYDPEKALESAVEAQIGSGLFMDFLHFIDYNLVSALHTSEMNPHYDLWKTGDAAEIAAESKAMQSAATSIRIGLEGKPLLREISPWLDDFEFWSKIAAQASDVQRNLQKLFLLDPNEKEAFWAYLHLQLELNRLRRWLKKVPSILSSVTGETVLEYCLKTHRSVENLLKIYVDKRGFLFKYSRYLLKRF